MKKHILCCTVLTVAITGAGNGNAELADKVSLHGTGSWAAGMTDNENRYFLWTEDGNLEHVEAALNIQAQVYETVSVYVQASFDRTWVGTDAAVDYAFAEWSFSDQLSFRGGKVNAPFMLHSDIADTRTALPFFNLPLGIYHNAGVDAYKGIGLTGTVSLPGAWTVQCDIYGGTIEQHPDRKVSYKYEVVTDDEGYYFIDDKGNPLDVKEYWYLEVPDQAVEKMIGGRIMVSPPLEGLRFGLSAYTGDQKYYESGSLTEHEEKFKDEALVDTVEDPIFAGVSIEYLSDRWEMRSEYLLTHQDDPSYQADRAYAELAYRFTEHWQVAVRYEHNTVNEFAVQGGLLFYDEIFGESVRESVRENYIGDFESLREHKELVLGLNYWFTPRLAVKGSYHRIQGNRVTVPADDEKYREGLWDGRFNEEETQLFLFGVQFSF